PAEAVRSARPKHRNTQNKRMPAGILCLAVFVPPPKRRQNDQASALMAAARRLLWRAALFLWMMFLSATRSITLVAFWNTSLAAALSPAAMDWRTRLMAVRSIERRLELCLLRSTD